MTGGARRHLTGWSLAGLAVLGGAGCRGESPPPGATRPATRPAAVRVDRRAGTVVLDATVAPQGRYAVLAGAIEYLLVGPGGKAYESVFVTACRAEDLAAALEQIAVRPGRPGDGDRGPVGAKVRILVEYDLAGRSVRKDADAFVAYRAGGAALKPRGWVYTGSRRTTDPATGQQVLQASLTQDLVGLHPADPSPLFQNARPEARQDNLYCAGKAVPPAGTEVRLIFQAVLKDLPPDARRVRVTIGGEVADVGFAPFVQGRARAMGLVGWVRQRADGTVEVLVQGPAGKVGEALKAIRPGPRGARVEKFQIADEPPRGDLEGFEVLYE